MASCPLTHTPRVSVVLRVPCARHASPILPRAFWARVLGFPMSCPGALTRCGELTCADKGTESMQVCPSVPRWPAASPALGCNWRVLWPMSWWPSTCLELTLGAS